MKKIIDNITDLKNLDVNSLPLVAKQYRKILINKISKTGGHLGPNLGIVELTIALHYVFNSPIDKFIFDVSHQTYVHKMLTGRMSSFINEKDFKNISGFSAPNESEHDLFLLGHTSTSISLASGVAKARDLKNEKYNVIALIGDGSLSGGEAYEGLNTASELNSNFIIIINDNEMSIAENHGGYYNNLTLLRKTHGKSPNNLFKALGFDYKYIENGNNVKTLVKEFKKIKDIDHPIVVHIHTLKGKGYLPAMNNKEQYHSVSPFDIKSGKQKFNFGNNVFQQKTNDFLINLAKEDSNLIIISSATPSIIDLGKEDRENLKNQYVDVGIAEENAIGFASGLAKNGAHVVYPVFGSFLQRAYDQIQQDLALNNSPATVLVFLDSVYGMGGPTHNGLYDISFLTTIPNLIYLAPTSLNEYLNMLKYSINQNKYAIAIRVPLFDIKTNEIDNTDYSIINKSKIIKNGKNVALIAVGSLFSLAIEICEELENKYNIHPTLINPIFLSGLDTDLLTNLEKNHQLVITLEEGILDGGYGEKISAFYGDKNIKVKNFGLEKSFFGYFDPIKLLKENKLIKEDIIDYILKTI